MTTGVNRPIVWQIQKALDILPRQMNTREAWAMLLAIGLQESRFEARRQLIKQKDGSLTPTGPAKGYWQFERGGGVAGVLRHSASRYWVHLLCRTRGVEPTSLAIWNAIETDDVLAAGIARLLLFTDPKRLPAIGDSAGAWDLYMRTWRPGKPHESTWPRLYGQAVAEAQRIVL